MRYKRFWFFLLATLLAVPAQAQWYHRLGAALRHVPVSRGPQIPAPTPALSTGVERAVAQTVTQSAPSSANLAKSILLVKEKELLLRASFPTGTAFVLEETYQGKKYLWGITATHYLFKKPAVKRPKQYKSFRVPFVIQSSAGMGDVSLFPLPPELADQITPLPLASRPPQVGEELRSVGFFDKSVNQEEHRIVSQITPARMITSLQVDPEIKREGACGSPVLNQQGEVVGMHIGSSYHCQTGYVVPAAHIRQALAAYHQHNEAPQPLLYNGVLLGTIAINESIREVYFYKQGALIGTFSAFHHEKEVDYAHLEALAANQYPEVDRIEFTIERNPLSTQEHDQKYYEYVLSYDVQSGKTVRGPLTSSFSLY